MPKIAIKLLGNQSVEISQRVTNVRLRKAGVTIGKDMSLKRKKSSTTSAVPQETIRRLAGA